MGLSRARPHLSFLALKRTGLKDFRGKFDGGVEMKRFFKRIVERVRFKEDLPPPYREEDVAFRFGEERIREDRNPETSASFEVLDLLANCHIADKTDTDTEVEYAEIFEDMGVWHSTPLSQRHKSKISLTWVLKENLENLKPQEDKVKTTVNKETERYQRHSQKYVLERPRKSNRVQGRERVVGRNEFYHNLKFKSAVDLVTQESWSEDTSVGTEEWKRRHRHRHRKKKRRSGRFGYDIRDLDSFLSEASIDRPGNIPVVVAYPTVLYQTQRGQLELTLPLGTVVNAVFKNREWLFAQTPHGEEGYLMYNACLPLGILPNRTSPQKKTPCWESSTDLYPRPCGNLTDNEKENLRGRTKSECRHRPKKTDRARSRTNAEEHFDTLYLKTKSVCSNVDKLYEDWEPKKELRRKVSDVKLVKRHTLLVVNSDFKGNPLNRTLTVQQGDVVVLIQGRGETDVDSEWFFVRKKDGEQGFIPAFVAGHGYI